MLTDPLHSQPGFACPPGLPQMNHADHRVKKTLKPSRAYAASAGLALSLALLVNWLAEALKGDVPFCSWTGLEATQCRAAGGQWMALTAIGAALAAVAVLGTKLMSRLRPVDELVETDLRPAEVLVTLVSKPAAATGPSPVQPAHMPEPSLQSAPPMPPLPLLPPMPPNWQPLVQAMQAHGQVLQRLLLVGSRQSGPFLAQCSQVLQTVLPGPSPTIQHARHCPDYFCLADVRDTLSREIAALQRDPALQGARIVVDITGGTKTASIAAAIAAMERDVALQYVEGATVRTYRIGAQRWQAW